MASQPRSATHAPCVAHSHLSTRPPQTLCVPRFHLYFRVQYHAETAFCSSRALPCASACCWAHVPHCRPPTRRRTVHGICRLALSTYCPFCIAHPQFVGHFRPHAPRVAGRAPGPHILGSLQPAANKVTATRSTLLGPSARSSAVSRPILCLLAARLCPGPFSVCSQHSCVQTRSLSAISADPQLQSWHLLPHCRTASGSHTPLPLTQRLSCRGYHPCTTPIQRGALSLCLAAHLAAPTEIRHPVSPRPSLGCRAALPQVPPLDTMALLYAVVSTDTPINHLDLLRRPTLLPLRRVLSPCLLLFQTLCGWAAPWAGPHCHPSLGTQLCMRPCAQEACTCRSLCASHGIPVCRLVWH